LLKCMRAQLDKITGYFGKYIFIAEEVQGNKDK